MTTERKAFETWHMDEFGWNDAENREWLNRFRAWQTSRKVALEDAAKALHMVGNGRVFSSEAAGMAAWIKQQFEEAIRSLK